MFFCSIANVINFSFQRRHQLLFSLWIITLVELIAVPSVMAYIFVVQFHNYERLGIDLPLTLYFMWLAMPFPIYIFICVHSVYYKIRSEKFPTISQVAICDNHVEEVPKVSVKVEVHPDYLKELVQFADVARCRPLIKKELGEGFRNNKIH